jgi:transglutaminase-like putative cysteine protease
MARTNLALFRHVLLVLTLLGCAAQAVAQEYFFAVEVNGVLCGYSKIVASPLQAGPQAFTSLTHETVVRGTLLGAPLDGRITLTYHIDPATKAFTYHESVIEQGPARLSSAVRVEGGKARVSDGRGGPESVVELPADVVLDNTLTHPRLVADFVAGSAGTKTYQVFDGRDNAVRETAYTRVGTERLTLAGRTFEAVVLDSVDRTTGVTARLWIDPLTGIAVQTRTPGNRLSYLAEAAVVDDVMRAARRPSLDPAIMAKANVAIPDIRGIAYMKVRVAARPSGVWLTPEALNFPGQRFTGTVRENAVDGVFEIEHARYDGANAPPFPAVLAGDPSLKRFLGSDDYIQAGDPVIADKAREITAGAKNSWEAARRLSAWVAQHIKGAIPGGVTARGTFDQGAGDCGGHSFLLAAMCRSVGIPARAVWGCMYTPQGGGAFGQHAWNEVYMGPAGWIPLDTTIGEPDYVDSGHIRIGVFGSVATSLNARSIEILEHRGLAASGPAR